MKNLLDKKHKDLLTLKDYTKEEIENILKLAAEVKKDGKLYKDLLSGKSLAMLFDKHSTRTRLSFEVGISQLGGNSIYLDSKNLQINRGETLGDTAKVFSKYLDGVIIRTYSQKTVEVFAKESTIPVINGLTDLYHPCQILSDLFTIYELGLLKKDLKFTYVGDSNNVLNSLLIGFTMLGLNITVGCPEKCKPLKEVINYIKKQSEISGSNFKIVYDPLEAVADADIVYTDVWVSMGDKESAGKIKELKDFQINLKLLSYAKPDVKIMHCLPAHRGEEITSEAIDGSNSIVWVQAENRLHAQKALLVYLYSI
jgi:ornithine carbamoyltransferase